MAARMGNPRWSPVSACARLPDGWAEFAGAHCACLAALQDGERGVAYDRAVAALQPFIRVSHHGFSIIKYHENLIVMIPPYKTMKN
jgi:hypothetical protein